MMKMRFYNESGELCLGGGRGNETWRLTAAEGLSLPERSFHTAVYPGCDGVEITGEIVAARTVTLSGDIVVGNDFDERFTEAMQVLNRPGVLEINCRTGARRIAARCSAFRQGERKGKYQLFVLQFICESPYFEADSAIEVGIYRVAPLLNSETILPAMFSKRVTRSTIYYGGNVNTEPVFYIVAGNNPTDEISIINHTSGERLGFDYIPMAGELITVDVKNRRIYNADGDNLISYLSDDSFFNGFHLYPGDNEIEVLMGNFNEELIVSMKYTERFLEAVV